MLSKYESADFEEIDAVHERAKARMAEIAKTQSSEASGKVPAFQSRTIRSPMPFGRFAAELAISPLSPSERHAMHDLRKMSISYLFRIISEIDFL